MIIGVTAFAWGTSALTNLLQTYDKEDEKFHQKLQILNKIYKEYCLPFKLYDNVKKSISFQNNDIEDLQQFVDELPHDLKLEVSLFIFEKTFKKIDYLRDKPVSFIAWICPLLKSLVKFQDQYTYFEGDDVSCIYFHKKGTAGYVLPRHMNLMYVKMDKGQHTGISCILGSFNENDDFHIDKWYSRKDNLKR